MQPKCTKIYWFKVLALFPTGVLAKLTLFPTGIEVGMGRLIKKLFVCLFLLPSSVPVGKLSWTEMSEIIYLYVFFPRSLSLPRYRWALVLPFLSKLHILLLFFAFFWYNSGDRFHISLIDVRMNYKGYEWGQIRYNNIFLFLNTAICDSFYFSYLWKMKWLLQKSVPVFKFSWEHPHPQNSIELAWNGSSKVGDE